MNEENKYFYEFGEFRLEPREKTLYHAGRAVALKPKAVEMLIVLIENAEAVVSKKDLMDAVWQDVFVEENNLSVNIYELRKALAKLDAAQKFIETVPRRGFRFGVPVEKITSESASNGNHTTQKSFIAEAEKQQIEDAAKSEEQVADDKTTDSISPSLWARRFSRLDAVFD